LNSDYIQLLEKQGNGVGSSSKEVVEGMQVQMLESQVGQMESENRLL
jgi:hypothetical protein